MNRLSNDCAEDLTEESLERLCEQLTALKNAGVPIVRRFPSHLSKAIADERIGRYRCVEMQGMPVPENTIFRWHARRLSTMQLTIQCDERGEPLYFALKLTDEEWQKRIWFNADIDPCSWADTSGSYSCHL